MNKAGILATTTFALATAGVLGAWQGPLYDTVTVDLPYQVRIHDKVLPPGEYTIQEQRSAADNGVLHIYSDDGMDFEATALTIDTVDKSTPEDTQVVLQQVGDDYYFDKVWIQGKNYGYEFVLPESVRERQQEVRQSRNLPARWERRAAMTASSSSSGSQSFANKRAESSSNHADRVVPDTRMENRIQRQVRHELVMLPYYGVFDHFAYKVNGGNVTLLGEVTRPTLKSSAENVVKDIEGVNQVTNNIKVLPISPNDDRIRMAAYRAIYGHTALNRYALQAVPPIHIVVENGNITLEGVVANEADKNIAVMQAKSVPGAFAVNDNLRVENRS